MNDSMWTCQEVTNMLDELYFDLKEDGFEGEEFDREWDIWAAKIFEASGWTEDGYMDSVGI